MENPICLNSNTYHGYTLEEAVQGAVASGIHAIEIAAVRGYTEHARADMSEAEVDAVLALLAANDLTAVGLCGHTNILTEDGRTAFVENLDLARRLGVQYVVTSAGETHGDASIIDDDTEVVEHLRQLAEEAARRDLTLAIETHGNNYATGGQVSALLAKVGAANLRIAYDTGNVIFYGGTEPYDDLDAHAAEVVDIHLKDKTGAQAEWNFPAVGRGDLDVARVLSILEARGCAAPLSIEIEFTSAGPSSVEEVHEALAHSVRTIRTIRTIAN